MITRPKVVKYVGRWTAFEILNHQKDMCSLELTKHKNPDFTKILLYNIRRFTGFSLKSGKKERRDIEIRTDLR